MQFRILGSLEVSDGDRPVELGGYKQRAALAVLLLSANRTVKTDRLVDDLWGERPPRQATITLQSYLSNLRRALEPGRPKGEPPRLIQSRPSGYALVVDTDDIDAVRFERLAGEGRTLLRAERVDDARATLREALGLWRGPALHDFVDEPFASTEAGRLEELRAAALEDRIAADLAAGEHTAVVAEVQTLLATEPLREQLWAHLIVALYRSGRQADALAAYHECRRALDEELGIDPSPALRQLETDVLQQSPSLDWHPPEAGRAAMPSPGSRGNACLIHRDPTGRPHMYPLPDDADRLVVGRESDADIWISWDSTVSRRHAELEWDGERWALVDEGSSNGSFVNDERIEGRRELADGDAVRFGETVMSFSAPSGAAATTFRQA